MKLKNSDAAKLIFSKKAYLSRLCGILGSPHELRDYLKEMEWNCTRTNGMEKFL